VTAGDPADPAARRPHRHAWRLGELLYRFRYPLSLICLVGAFLIAPLAQITHIDNDLTAWFSKTDPLYQDYERLRKEFEGSRTLIVALEGDTVFTPQGLDHLRRISKEIERVPTVQRVYSLATANTVEAIGSSSDDGGIRVEPLIDRAGPIDAAAVKARALRDPMLVGDLLSKNGRVASILINFDEDRIDAVRGGTIEKIHEIAARDLPAGLALHFNGSIEISETYNRVTVQNMETFTPPILLCTLAAIYLMFRSLKKTLLTLVAIGVSLVWTLGLYTLMGFTFNVLSSMIISVVVVLAIADDVHIIQHFNELMRETGDRAYAFKTTVADLAVPLFAASGTTALGMLSLATSDVHAVRAFGIGCAVGVMVDFVISLVFVPMLLTFVKGDVAPPPQERWLMEPMRRVAAFSTRRSRLVMGVAGVVAVLSIAGILNLRVDTNHINFFSDGHPLHESADLIDRELSGVYSFQVFFEGPADSMREPATLARMDRLQQEILALPNVRKAVSLVDYVKRVNRELNDGRKEAEVIPTSGDLIAQELLVLGLSDDGRRELEHVAASDYSRAQMTVRLASMSSDIVFAQINEAETLARRAFEGSEVKPTVTGSGRLFAQLDHYLVMSQLSSFATAFVTVFGVIFVIFRSFKFGLLAIVPNLFPVLAILGAMGWLDISLNVATVMLASVALGVVDDDTIHFISRYRREVAEGEDTDGGIMAATMHEGRAAFTTALINSCAYAVLMMSEYRPTAWFGGLLALTMVVAFLAEVFILPATIKLLPSLYSAERLRGGAKATRDSDRVTAV
jgi:predicted RND superfamily exporter protein